MLNMIFFQPFMFGTALAEQMGFNLIDSGYHLIEFNQVDQTAGSKLETPTARIFPSWYIFSSSRHAA